MRNLAVNNKHKVPLDWSLEKKMPSVAQLCREHQNLRIDYEL